MFQAFTLESEIGPSMVEGELVKTVKHDVVAGVYTYEFKVSKGVIYIAASGGILKEVSYHFHSILPWSRKKRAEELFKAYEVDGAWVETREDRFGNMFRSKGGLYYAALGKGARYLDFGSMSFHEAKYRIVS